MFPKAEYAENPTKSRQNKKNNIMYVFKVTAPSDRGQIGKGFSFTINSTSTDPSNAIKEYLIRNGYDQKTIGYYSSGNWKVEKIS